jgi:hypothetical protein
VGKQSPKPSTHKKKYHIGVHDYKDLAINPRAMDNKTSLNSFYTLQNQTKEKKDDGYHSNENDDGEMERVENVVAKKLINKTTT